MFHVLVYAWQELLPSMKDVYGVELEEPKEKSMKDYDRYRLPSGDTFLSYCTPYIVWLID